MSKIFNIGQKVWYVSNVALALTPKLNKSIVDEVSVYIDGTISYKLRKDGLHRLSSYVFDNKKDAKLKLKEVKRWIKKN